MDALPYRVLMINKRRNVKDDSTPSRSRNISEKINKMDDCQDTMISFDMLHFFCFCKYIGWCPGSMIARFVRYCKCRVH